MIVDIMLKREIVFERMAGWLFSFLWFFCFLWRGRPNLVMKEKGDMVRSAQGTEVFGRVCLGCGGARVVVVEWGKKRIYVCILYTLSLSGTTLL